MPLPDKNAPWPPVANEVRTALDDWAAWYSSNPDKIADRYYWRSTRVGKYGQQPVNRPSQFRGGLIGQLARFFWGEPIPFGEKRTKIHVPLPGDIARTSSDLLFSEPITLKATDKTTQARLEDLLEKGLNRTLLAAGEVTAALGGGFLRVCWDDQVAEGPWIDVVHADAAAPEFRSGALMAVTFWSVIAVDGTKVTRHLERHERGGVILHGVYEGSDINLGKPVDLQGFPETRGLPAERTVPVGPRGMTVSYVPNTITNRDWRDVPGTKGMGLSDFQGSETLFDAVDETYTSWMRDVRLAKSRIIVPNGYLTNNGVGQGMTWEDREVFAGMNIAPTDPNTGITLNQFMIRWEEHKGTSEELVRQIIRNAGYSTGTFGDDADGRAITATEIKAKESRSGSTRARKSELFAVGIAEITETLLTLEASALFPGVKAVPVERPEVRFQDSIQDDPLNLAQTALALRNAEAASTETLVALLHPDWDSTAQAEEVARIHAEAGRAVPDPTQIGAEGADNADLAGAGGGPGTAGP